MPYVIAVKREAGSNSVLCALYEVEDRPREYSRNTY